MAITNFIPTVWSENLSNKLEKRYVAVANCSHEWEGDIKQCGDRVKICGLDPVSVFTYNKNSDLPAPATLSDNACELVINQAKAFNFQIDDIDKAQTKPNLMDAAIRQAADALAAAADRYVYSLSDSVDQSHVVELLGTTDEEVIDGIINTILGMQSKGVREELILEVTPAVAGRLYKAKLDILSDNTALFESGCVGAIAGCKIFVSPYVLKINNGGADFNYCYLRTKRSIAFAEQLSEIEAYRPENRFADAVKGLHLYGAKIVRPEELSVIKISTLID
jgi:hypothetical protein